MRAAVMAAAIAATITVSAEARAVHRHVGQGVHQGHHAARGQPRKARGRATHRRRPDGRGGHNASVFCDRVTATGGMRCGAMQFAHRTLPLRSWHNLCSTAGRCVVAQVVDRGPYVAGREFDLSTGLAHALGVSGLGHVYVR